MANTKISALPAVTAPALTDEIPVNQSGTTKKTTLSQLIPDGPILLSTTNFTSSNIINDFGAGGVVILAAPGANLMYVVHRAIFEYTYGGVAYTDAVNLAQLTLKYNAGAFPPAVNFDCRAAIRNATVSNVIFSVGEQTTNVSIPRTSFVNTGLIFIGGTGFAAGNGTARLKVYYTILDLS